MFSIKTLLMFVFVSSISTSILAADDKCTGNVDCRLRSKFEIGGSIANDESKYEFLTPNAGSRLSYDMMKTKQFFVDTKYRFMQDGLNSYYVYGRGSWGQTKNGEVRDDDVVNLYGAMSYHQLNQNNNQIEIGLGRQIALSDKHILSFDLGYFRKNIHTSSRGIGYYAYADDVNGNVVESDFDSTTDQKSNAVFKGISFGPKIEKIIDKDSSISLQVHGLITQYSSNNYWRERDITWSLSNHEMGFNGIDIKAEYLTAITNHADLSLFAYYQTIKIKGLNETNEGVYISNQYVHSYAMTKSYGIGVGVKFF